MAITNMNMCDEIDSCGSSSSFHSDDSNENILTYIPNVTNITQDDFLSKAKLCEYVIDSMHDFCSEKHYCFFFHEQEKSILKISSLVVILLYMIRHVSLIQNMLNIMQLTN